MYTYDPEWVVEYFDTFGEQEWERLVKTPTHLIAIVNKPALIRHME